MKRHKGKREKIVCTDVRDLLQIRTLKMGARKEKFGNRISGRPRYENGAEVPQKTKKNEKKFVSKRL